MSVPAVRIKGIVTPVTAVTARAPAKVNLQLAVGPARAHGYHDVVTVYHAVSLFDEVTVAPAARNSVSVTGEGAGSVPANGTNLAARAVAALLGAVGPGAKDSPGLAIRISKRIPVAAGPGRRQRRRGCGAGRLQRTVADRPEPGRAVRAGRRNRQ